MTKNIVVFSDGTGQEGGVTPDSNVFKLFKMSESRSPRQVAFYDHGLGMGEGGFIATKIGAATGAGISRNILECYRFIFDNYCVDDKIFLFGFSRGAATVRSLAGFIDLFGILPASRPDFIERAYDIYKINDEDKRRKKATRFVQANGNLWCDVHFLGVWDTVSALGAPYAAVNVILDWLPSFRHKFHDLKLSKRVQHARHALSIDDERKTFHPTLWDEDIDKEQTLKQVWFSGVHTDVGGGYKEQTLSDVPLNWMVREAVQQGLQIYSRHEVESMPDPRGVMHDSREGGARIFRKSQRSWGERAGMPTVHESVVERATEWKELAYDPWILKGKHGYKTEDAVSDAHELQTAAENLCKHVEELDASAIGARDDSLERLRAKIEAELEVVHANSPRGNPEAKQDDAGVARRERGEARGEFFTQARVLMERIGALEQKLETTGVSWEEVSPLKELVKDSALKLWRTYLTSAVDQNVGREPTEFRSGGRLRGYTYEDVPPGPG